MGKYGLLGAHLEYSYSPEIHSKFGDYQYDLIEIPEEKLKDVVNSPEYDGFNVTIPYKRSVITLCDEVSSEALRIGAVNTIVKENGLKKGYNTDYFGFCYMLKRNNIELKGKKCMVLGNGGASAMVQTVMRDQGASEIVVVSRHGEDNYDNLDRHFDSEIIVNATPVGMYPNNGVSLVNVDDFPNLSGAVDLIYNPNKTKFILDATTRGIPACGGLSMLVAQAEKSSELFQHRVIDDEEIDAAIYDIRSELLNVVLIGMPGAGKTFLGRRIAEREGMSIPEIFRTKGEDYFRNVETEVLRETCKMSGVVIACGGGIVKRKQNYNLAKQNSRIIWVKRDLDKLDTEGRPISQTKSVEEIYEARKDLYEAWSDYFIDNNQDFN